MGNLVLTCVESCSNKWSNGTENDSWPSDPSLCFTSTRLPSTITSGLDLPSLSGSGRILSRTRQRSDVSDVSMMGDIISASIVREDSSRHTGVESPSFST